MSLLVYHDIAGLISHPAPIVGSILFELITLSRPPTFYYLIKPNQRYSEKQAMEQRECLGRWWSVLEEEMSQFIFVNLMSSNI